MLTIRPEQIDVFARELETQLRTSTAGFLREACPDALADLPSTVLELRVTQALEAGRGYGFTSSNAFRIFTALMFQYGPGFHEHPTVDSVLHDPTLQPDDRLNRLVLQSSERTWDELATLAAGYAWPDEVEPTGSGDAQNHA